MNVETAPVPVQTTPDQRQAAARVVLAILLAALAAATLHGFVHALLWAGILAIATSGLYRRVLARAKVPRTVIAAGFTAAAALVVLLPLGLVLIEAGREARGAITWLNEARRHGLPPPTLPAGLPYATEFQAWWQENLATPSAAQALLGRLDRGDLLQRGRSLGAELLHDALTFAFTLISLFFLYLHQPEVADQLARASRRLFGTQGEQLGRQIAASVHGTVDGLVLVGLGVGLVLGLGYWLAGVPHPALLGVATAIGAMLPMGSVLALAVACLLLVAQGSTPGGALLFVGGGLVIFAADHFIRPALIGGATRLPFLWVLLGILGGVETFGLLGLFLGPAIMAAAVLLWRDWTRAPKSSAPFN